MLNPSSLVVLACLLDVTAGQVGSSLWSAWAPLAVRSPYLNAWLNTANVPLNLSNIDGVSRVPTIWPQFIDEQVIIVSFANIFLLMIFLALGMARPHTSRQ